MKTKSSSPRRRSRGIDPGRADRGVGLFASAALDNLKIEGGAELLRAMPNVNFSKSNFSRL